MHLWGMECPRLLGALRGVALPLRAWGARTSGHGWGARRGQPIATGRQRSRRRGRGVNPQSRAAPLRRGGDVAGACVRMLGADVARRCGWRLAVGGAVARMDANGAENGCGATCGGRGRRRVHPCCLVFLPLSRWTRCGGGRWRRGRLPRPPPSMQVHCKPSRSRTAPASVAGRGIHGESRRPSPSIPPLHPASVPAQHEPPAADGGRASGRGCRPGPTIHGERRAGVDGAADGWTANPAAACCVGCGRGRRRGRGAVGMGRGVGIGTTYLPGAQSFPRPTALLPQSAIGKSWCDWDFESGRQAQNPFIYWPKRNRNKMQFGGIGGGIGGIMSGIGRI